jgi:GrpB-like predicted nucleotidyltransferase (UPF0157 family)
MAEDANLDMGDPVEIVEYDAGWPDAYERERALIATTLGELATGIEHMGSTAVPGLGAKPIIDIMVGVRSLADGEECVGPLEGLGYEYKGEFGIPRRLYFRKMRAGRRSHQIHLVELGRDFWERHLLFRDYLREHGQAAREYEELKVRLAAEFRTDREGYTEAKTEFIEGVMAKASAIAK